MLSWFEEFNDEQRNIILKKILVRKMCGYESQEFGHILLLSDRSVDPNKFHLFPQHLFLEESLWVAADASSVSSDGEQSS